MEYNYTSITPITGSSLGEGDLTTDAWGIQKVSLPKSLFHGLWTYDIPQTMWFMYENGSQVYSSTAIVSSGGAGTLTTSSTYSSLVLESRECPRYQPNRGHLFSTALICPNKTNDGTREWGLGTTENQILFRLKSNGKLYAVKKSGGVQTHEEEINTSTVPNFNVEKGNIYDIQFQWRGVGNYYFYINNVHVHSLLLLGTLTVLSIENPAMPIRYAATRTTQDVSMSIGCADITSENGATNNTEQYSSCYSENIAVLTNTPVLVVKNPLTISSKTNTRTVTLARITVSCSKKAVFKVWTTRTAGDITGATFKPIGTGSYLECDSVAMDATAVKATAVTIANLQFVTSITTEASVRVPVDNPYRDRIEFPLVRGDYLIVTCTSATATAECVIEFGEQV